MDAVWTFMQDHTLEAAIAAIVISALNIAFTVARRS
jgi:hypothetical protein